MPGSNIFVSHIHEDDEHIGAMKTLLRERGFDCGERCGPADEKRDYYIGENDNIPKRKDRNTVRRRDGLVVALKSLWQN